MKRIYTTKYFDEEELRTCECADKQRVLKFLKSLPWYCAASGYFNDVVTGELIESISLVAYKSGQWSWNSRDIYHFEKYNLELDPEFIQYVLNQH